MGRSQSRGAPPARPFAEAVEGRRLPSSGPLPAGLTHVERPNVPVAPYSASSDGASFIDPSANVANGNRVVIGRDSLVAPFAVLDGRRGVVGIGSYSAVLDNAHLLTGPGDGVPSGRINVGDSVEVGSGATIRGGSVLGAFASQNGDQAVSPVGIGSNALVDGATIQPGAIVSSLARVGPGVTVPSGMVVLPGADVTTEAQATDPALGQVRKATAADLSDLGLNLAHDNALALGYAKLYRGNSSTGSSPGARSGVSGVDSGDLTTVEGTSPEPGSTNGVTFEPSKPTGPTFPDRAGQAVQGLFAAFPGRATGKATFKVAARKVAKGQGGSDSIRADDGQPIQFASAPQLGRGVTIRSPAAIEGNGSSAGSGKISIGKGFQAGDGSVLLGGDPSATASRSWSVTLGDSVTIGAGAVVEGSSLGSGATIGPRALVLDSEVPAGATIPPGEILIDGKAQGTVGWSP